MKKIALFLSVVIATAMADTAAAKPDTLSIDKTYYPGRRAFYELTPVKKHNIVMLGNSLTERGLWGEYFQPAYVLNPRYLFCDEPNSGLDPQTSIVIDNLIHEITREYNITTIINTHDMNSVMEIGEKIVYIHEGRKWWEGTKDDILHADNPELNDFVFASAMAKKAKLAAK